MTIKIWISLLLGLFLGAPALAEAPIPALVTPVTDQAGMLSPRTEEYLNHELSRLNQSGGSQVAVLTIPTLDGEDIAGYSIRVADQWKLGNQQTDRGVLLLIAQQERKLRIEVGQGNEGNLTDVQSKRIIEEVITPLFKAGDINSGVISGVAAILQATDPDFTLSSGAPERRVRRAESRGSPLFPILFFIIVMIILASRGGRGGRGGGLGAFTGGFIGGYGAGGGFGGGGFGGGSGGGFGGFGGGGGGFSGGGASGEW